MSRKAEQARAYLRHGEPDCVNCGYANEFAWGFECVCRASQYYLTTFVVERRPPCTEHRYRTVEEETT